MRIFSMLWAFIPAPAKIWVAIGLIASLMAFVGFWVWKIDRGGYKRCEAIYAASALELKESSRKEILALERQYDEIKRKIHNQEGVNPVVGVRVEYAIDSMPSGALDR